MDSDIDTVKIPKRYTKPKNTSAMRAYYKKSENQKNLRERIAKYKESINDTQKKIDELVQYLTDDIDV